MTSFKSGMGVSVRHLRGPEAPRYARTFALRAVTCASVVVVCVRRRSLDILAGPVANMTSGRAGWLKQ